MSWEGGYSASGELHGNVYQFTMYRGGKHGEGEFTFSGDRFSGKCKDNWQKSGTWDGHRKKASL